MYHIIEHYINNNIVYIYIYIYKDSKTVCWCDCKMCKSPLQTFPVHKYLFSIQTAFRVVKNKQYFNLRTKFLSYNEDDNIRIY